ncbi:MAG TPA: hypothetical protein VK142_04685, partial [Bacillota bacterium]|nr:hypothetical protein [Bacillota bacterium]
YTSPKSEDTKHSIHVFPSFEIHIDYIINEDHIIVNECHKTFAIFISKYDYNSLQAIMATKGVGSFDH